MKLSRNFLAAAFAALLVINGCDTSGNDPITQPQPDPTLTATINGRSWTATGPEDADNRIYAHRIVVGKLVINAFHTENGKTDALELRISSPKEGINILRPELDQPEHTASYTPGNTLDSIFYMTATDSGQVIIDQFDENTTRISGTFWFTAKDNGQNPVSVINGTFKDVYLRP
jgi:hypothetical protein